MKELMWALISQRHEVDRWGSYRDVLESDYSRYFVSKSIHLVPISNDAKEISCYFDELPIDGVILSGGGDVHPRFYGQSPSDSMNVSQDRDVVENEVLRISIERKVPVLGICRGMQKINIYFGGTLVSSINEVTNHSPPGSNHPVTFDCPALVEVVGSDTIEVNSYHDYGVSENAIASNLRSFAISNDGIIEGLFHPTLPIAGIQWHPERKSPNEPLNDFLCEAFKNRELFWRNACGASDP